MSNLLEQAIVDAAALREVALKNAEAALIEKYSKEFKESVEKLLEQEEPLGADTETPAIADPMAGMAASPMPDPQKEKAFDSVPSSFLEGDEDEMITIDFDQLKKQLSDTLGASPLLSSPEMPAATPEVQPMMENVEISEEEMLEAYEQGNKDIDGAIDDLTPLRKKSHNKNLEEDEELEEEIELEEAMEEDVLLKKKEVMQKRRAGKPAETGEEEQNEEEQDELEETIHISLSSSEEAEEELEEDLASAARNYGTAKKNEGEAARQYFTAAAEEASKPTSEKPPLGRLSSPVATTQTTKLEEDFEISEEEIAELQEYLEVDLDSKKQLRGQMGSTNTERQLQDNVEKAAARDARAAKKREEEEAALGDLKEKLEESLQSNNELEEKLAEVMGYIESLKENVEKLSISNAKLLYTNKVLGNVSLNERQKEQIVENISKSTSVLEAKTIYNTLQSTVSGVNSTKKPVESLSEALIRGNSPFITRKKQEGEDSFAERMKKLAGITNKS